MTALLPNTEGTSRSVTETGTIVLGTLGPLRLFPQRHSSILGGANPFSGPEAGHADLENPRKACTARRGTGRAARGAHLSSAGKGNQGPGGRPGNAATGLEGATRAAPLEARDPMQGHSGLRVLWIKLEVGLCSPSPSFGPMASMQPAFPARGTRQQLASRCITHFPALPDQSNHQQNAPALFCLLVA